MKTPLRCAGVSDSCGSPVQCGPKGFAACVLPSLAHRCQRALAPGALGCAPQSQRRLIPGPRSLPPADFAPCTASGRGPVVEQLSGGCPTAQSSPGQLQCERPHGSRPAMFTPRVGGLGPIAPAQRRHQRTQGSTTPASLQGAWKPAPLRRNRGFSHLSLTSAGITRALGVFTYMHTPKRRQGSQGRP